MRTAPWVQRLAAFVLLTTAALAQSLGIGDPAPKLKLSGWVKGEPLASFERDTVYVVEFWATWCVPCRKSIPHLSELQKRYADSKVRMLGISVREEDPRKVAPFVEQLGEQMSYAVATDLVLEGANPSQGAMVLGWLKPAGEVALPTVFIVDRDGKIAWIGDTMAVDQPLAQILDGTWDLERARSAHKRRIKVNALHWKLNDQIRGREWQQTLVTIDEMLALSPEMEVRTAAWRFAALLALGREDEAYEYGKRRALDLLKDDALALNVLAWAIVDPEAKRKPARDLDFALRAAERAVALTEEKHAALLDTLALVHFERGNVARAIEVQEKAVKLSEGSGWHAELLARLEQFRAAKRAPEVTRNGDDGRLVHGGR
ncbi:MAG: redoxin family protein [Planctomycetes bacterium]|nr:redoxin family protein [Planctomycetota bacterium]